MHILFVFVDGIGLGDDDRNHNPFAYLDLPAFTRLAGGRRWVHATASVDEEGHQFYPLDATLGVEGLPQSGTGQATLFTGVNCAQVAGRHYGPYPHSKTRPVLAEKNLFRRIDSVRTHDDEAAAFANAYPDRFFEYVKRTDRWTVTTRCCLESSVRIRTTEDLKRGRAVPADIVGSRWPEPITLGMMPGTETDAARRLLDITSEHPLTLFEYYLTDKAGHKQDSAAAERVLASLDRLLSTLIDRMDPSRTLLLVTSDHGNLEDISTKSHTTNPVPFLAYGAEAARLGGLRSLVDVTPAIMDVIGPAKN